MDVLTAFAQSSLRAKMIALAVTVLVVELAFRRLAPASRAYARWTAFFQALGAVWTAVILALVYFLSVGPTRLLLGAVRFDPLDRRFAPEASSWRRYEANPLGPAGAARHQF